MFSTFELIFQKFNERKTYDYFSRVIKPLLGARRLHFSFIDTSIHVSSQYARLIVVWKHCKFTQWEMDISVSKNETRIHNLRDSVGFVTRWEQIFVLIYLMRIMRVLHEKLSLTNRLIFNIAYIQYRRPIATFFAIVAYICFVSVTHTNYQLVTYL